MHILVFCEDCGKKHQVEIDPENPAAFKFRCDECGFLIPVTPPETVSEGANELETDLRLIPSHERIDFGVVQGNQEKGQMLLVAAADGRKINLQGMASRALAGNIQVSRVSRMSFMVTVVDPSETGAEPLASFDGPGVELVDTISGAKVAVDVAFSRTAPKLEILPETVNLGEIRAGCKADGSFQLNNCGNGSLEVSLVPDPEYFTISTYFCITSPQQYSLAAGQEEKIGFFIKADPEIGSEIEYEQPVLIMSNDPHGKRVGRVLIQAKILVADLGSTAG